MKSLSGDTILYSILIIFVREAAVSLDHLTIGFYIFRISNWEVDKPRVSKWCELRIELQWVDVMETIVACGWLSCDLCRGTRLYPTTYSTQPNEYIVSTQSSSWDKPGSHWTRNQSFCPTQFMIKIKCCFYFVEDRFWPSAAYICYVVCISSFDCLYLRACWG